MSTQNNTMTCPLCGFETNVEYSILLHMEEYHSEGRSPFVADPYLDVPRSRDDTPATEQEGSSDGDAELVDCPVEWCLEQISLAELEDHINFHEMEENEEPTIDGDVAAAAAVVASGAGNEREYHSPYSRPEDVARSNREHERGRSRPPTNHDSAVDAWKKIFNRRQARKTEGSESRPAQGNAPRRRLGRSELGKHAYENRMPDSLVALLRKGKYTSAEGIIPVLARLLEQSSSTEYAFLCDPAVQHISKLRGEGGFCGYRNIQMLSSYIVGARAEGTEQLGNRIPSIFRIQEYIENAWDMGINVAGRIETGGIRGTRKYIGTPEAQAMFVGLQIPCEVEGFKSPKHGAAEAALFASVQQYFKRASFDPRDKVRCTNLPPIYFQHRGHSLTIVGLERRASGSLKLLVFDPMFHDTDGVLRLVGRVGRHGDSKDDKNKMRHAIHRSPDAMLKLYRRGNNYLRKYHEFELLRYVLVFTSYYPCLTAFTAPRSAS
ncbi:peptidase family C78-domain-containing protein [Xylaria longipes]|nr:peptidase family C78-domain-containing protein [Xylaria longipes]